jgi:hypothetical protein
MSKEYSDYKLWKTQNSFLGAVAVAVLGTELRDSLLGRRSTTWATSQQRNSEF